MELLTYLLISTMLYAGIDDFFCMSIDEKTWILIHILVFLINWQTILILPCYIFLRKIKHIGLADWIIFTAAFNISNNYYVLIITSYLLIISSIDIKSRKSPLILAITVGSIISM